MLARMRAKAAEAAAAASAAAAELDQRYDVSGKMDAAAAAAVRASDQISEARPKTHTQAHCRHSACVRLLCPAAALLRGPRLHACVSSSALLCRRRGAQKAEAGMKELDQKYDLSAKYDTVAARAREVSDTVGAAGCCGPAKSRSPYHSYYVARQPWQHSSATMPSSLYCPGGILTVMMVPVHHHATGRCARERGLRRHQSQPRHLAGPGTVVPLPRAPHTATHTYTPCMARDR